MSLKPRETGMVEGGIRGYLGGFRPDSYPAFGDGGGRVRAGAFGDALSPLRMIAEDRRGGWWTSGRTMPAQ